MRISPTIAPISVLARPCAPSALAPSMVPSMALQMWSESVPAMGGSFGAAATGEIKDACQAD